MGKTIAIFNHKGGVGKTTTTASIGAALAECGYSVLMIDLDPQSNLTDSFISEDVESTIYDSFVNGKPLPIMQVKDNLSIVPSCLDHSATELSISGRMQREFILKKLLASVRNQYDYLLLDCPPSLGLISINALAAADMVLVPVSAEILPSKGLRMLTDMVAQVQDGLNPELYIGGILLTRWESSNLSNSIEEALRESFGDVVYRTKIRKNIRLAEAPSTCKSILDYDPTSNGAKDYRELTKEIIKKQG